MYACKHAENGEQMSEAIEKGECTSIGTRKGKSGSDKTSRRLLAKLVNYGGEQWSFEVYDYSL